MCFKCYLEYIGHLISGEGIYFLKEKVVTLVKFGPQLMLLTPDILQAWLSIAENS